MIGVDALIISGFVFLIVYWNLKPLFIMAKFELKFIDACSEEDFIKCEVGAYASENFESSDAIYINGQESGTNFLIVLDKSTAIKFAKTLRTEINKITESEL